MTKGTPADLIRQEADLIEAGMMPGAVAPPSEKTDAETEAETEAGFDNMPV